MSYTPLLQILTSACLLTSPMYLSMQLVLLPCTEMDYLCKKPFVGQEKLPASKSSAHTVKVSLPQSQQQGVCYCLLDAILNSMRSNNKTDKTQCHSAVTPM